jgi:hypothetical protein
VHKREALISFTILRGIGAWYPLRWRDLNLPRRHHSPLILVRMRGTSANGTNRTNSADVMTSVVRGRPEVAFLDVRTVVDPERSSTGSTDWFRIGQKRVTFLKARAVSARQALGRRSRPFHCDQRQQARTSEFRQPSKAAPALHKRSDRSSRPL